MNIIPNKKKQLNNKYIYPLLYNKKKKSIKVMPKIKNSLKQNNLQNSKYSEELKIAYDNKIDNKDANKGKLEEKKEK